MSEKEWVCARERVHTAWQAKQKSPVSFLNFHNNYGDIVNVLAKKYASPVLGGYRVALLFPRTAMLFFAT